MEGKTTWHKDVQCYQISDKTSREVLGYFYTDLYPREGKYNHAAVFSIKSSWIHKGKRSLPVSVMICNFTRPTKDKPSLLTFAEVATFFHELGHVFHGILPKNNFSLINGLNVELDFVECPSQALEYWCYEEQFLTKITSHFKTNKKMPKEMMENIKKNKFFGQGTSYLESLILVYFDLIIHTDSDVDVGTVYGDIEKQLSHFVDLPGCITCHFEHLIDGYNAGYYGYLWSKVYAVEIFDKFLKSGDLFNKKLGTKYRKTILEKGGLEDGFTMLEDFLGHKPSMDLFMQELEKN